MKKAALLMLISGVLLNGCAYLKPSGEVTGVKSERQYAEETEAVAQDLYKTGRASTMDDARAQATAQANQEWFAAAKADEQKQKDEKFQKDLSKLDRHKE